MRAMSWLPARKCVSAICEAIKSDWRDVLCALKYSYAFVYSCSTVRSLVSIGRPPISSGALTSMMISEWSTLLSCETAGLVGAPSSTCKNVSLVLIQKQEAVTAPRAGQSTVGAARRTARPCRSSTPRAVELLVGAVRAMVVVGGPWGQSGVLAVGGGRVAGSPRGWRSRPGRRTDGICLSR